MSLYQCSECHNQVSTNAEVCPHCGNILKKSENQPIQYENKTMHVTCWGLGGSDAIVRKLESDLSKGWEIVSVVEDEWRGGILRHVYTVILKRPKKRVE